MSWQSSWSVLSHQSRGSVLSSQASGGGLSRRANGNLPASGAVAIAAVSVAAVAGHVWFWHGRRSR